MFSDTARLLLEKTEKWVYNNLNTSIFLIIITICACISSHLPFGHLAEKEMWERWGGGGRRREREAWGGVMSCLPHQAVLHIKVMLRQSDDTKSLVSMNFVSTWTGWRWWVWRDAFRHLPRTELHGALDSPSTFCWWYYSASPEKRDHKTDPLWWLQGVWITVVIINLWRH